MKRRGLKKPKNLVVDENANSFCILKPNWKIWQLFERVNYQWVFAGGKRPVRLDGQFVLMYLDRLGIDDKNQTYDKINIIVNGALRAWKEEK